jgi:hypothetical protein
MLKTIIALAVGLALTTVTSFANASPAAAPVLNLTGYQEPSGLIATFAKGTVADPYFGLYSLELARRGGLGTAHSSEKFIEWGLSVQMENGRFPRLCKENGRWRSCGKADSDDATLARWLQLLYFSTSESLAPARQVSFDNAERMLMSLEMENGVFSVFPHDTPGYKGYALFKDNVEVLSAFTQIAQEATRRGDVKVAQRYLARVTRLKAAINGAFGEKPFDMTALALPTNYNKWMFYPHAVAIPFGWLEGYYAPPTEADWAQWLTRYREDWIANSRTDFPWGLMALAAYETGPKSEAHCWLNRIKGYRRTNQHWNVLEEVAAQVLESKKLPNCAHH